MSELQDMSSLVRSNTPLIVIETNVFNQHQGQIESFFRLVWQRGEYSYFRERMRGSRNTPRQSSLNSGNSG